MGTTPTADLTPERAAKMLGIPAAQAHEPLSVAQVAQALTTRRKRTVRPTTVRGYAHRAQAERAAGRDRPGLFPAPDGREPISGWPYWYPLSIALFELSRPGQGAGGGRPSHRAVKAAAAAASTS